MSDELCFSFVIPIYNEEETLEELIKRLSTLRPQLEGQSEFIFVDDGSSDKSLEILKSHQLTNEEFRVLSFSRNFGHQMAVTAGMDVANGKAVIIMDADLQDPPELVLQMIEKWKEGWEVVYAKRVKREGESFSKKLTASIFYRGLRFLSNIEIPADTGDFRLVDRKVINAISQLRESDRFVRGLFAWVGFKQTAVEYERKERYAGETHYPYRKMLNLAFTAVMGFSDVPLKFAVAAGIFVSISSCIYAIFSVAQAFATGTAVPGWSSMIIVTSFLNGLLLMMLGVVGLYIGRIHEETKQRPLYIVRESFGLDQQITQSKGIFL